MTRNEPSPRAEETPAWLREIDHTGDIGIEVVAEDLRQLFARAAGGLFRVLTEIDRVAPRTAQHVLVEADDRDALLVRWLSELNFLHVTEGWLFCTFEINELSHRRLVACVRGELFDPDRHVLYPEIKAVTFHELVIRQRESGWHVQIIFDM